MAKLIELVDEFVQITLNSNKVYVGVLAEADLGGSTPYNERLITIKPLVSGYRHQETLEFVETTNYEEIETFGIRQNFFLKDIVSFTKMIPEVDEYFTGKTRIKNLLLSETKTISGIEPSAFYDADLVEALREEDTLKDHIAKAILKNDQS